MSGCLLDPPCVACAFGARAEKTAIIRVLIQGSDYGCTKGGGNVVLTESGVGLETRSGIRYLTEDGRSIAREKGYPTLAQQP